MLRYFKQVGGGVWIEIEPKSVTRCFMLIALPRPEAGIPFVLVNNQLGEINLTIN